MPTTPDWNLRQLIAHQGMVHRWAAAQLRGVPANTEALERGGQSAADPVEWLRDGAIEFVTALTQAPDDVEALVFLPDAPAPKPFWARRQCHETTIHAIDAMAAALGRAPAPEETWIGPELALDGIDELLRGFVTRRKSRLRSEQPLTVAVCPDEGDRAWLVSVSAEPAVTEVVASSDPRCRATDVRMDGGAVALYLDLWNRSPRVAEGDPGGAGSAVEGGRADDVARLWRERARIEW